MCVPVKGCSGVSALGLGQLQQQCCNALSPLSLQSLPLHEQYFKLDFTVKLLSSAALSSDLYLLAVIGLLTSEMSCF